MKKRIVWDADEREAVANNYIKLFGNAHITKGKIIEACRILPENRWRIYFPRGSRELIYKEIYKKQAKLPNLVGGGPLTPKVPESPKAVVPDIEVYNPPLVVDKWEFIKDAPTVRLVEEIERRRHVQFETLLSKISAQENLLKQILLAEQVQPPTSSLPVFQSEERAKPPKQKRIGLIGILQGQFNDLKLRYRLCPADFLFVDKDKNPNEMALPTSTDLFIINQKFSSHSWINLVKDFSVKRGISYKMIYGGLDKVKGEIESYLAAEALKESIKL